MDTEEKAIRKSAQQNLGKEMRRWMPIALMLGVAHYFLFQMLAGARVGIVGGIIVTYFILMMGWVSYAIRLVTEMMMSGYEVIGRRIETLRLELGLPEEKSGVSVRTTPPQKSGSTLIH